MTAGNMPGVVKGAIAGAVAMGVIAVPVWIFEQIYQGVRGNEVRITNLEARQASSETKSRVVVEAVLRRLDRIESRLDAGKMTLEKME